MSVEIQITGLDELRDDLNKIEKIAGEALRRFVSDVVSEYKAQAFITGAIDTKAFVSGIDGREVSAKQFIVSSDVNYSEIIEHGRSDTELDRFDEVFNEMIKGNK
jgi:hypothetical protein